GEYELRRRCLWLICAQRPFRVIQIEFRVHLAKIHTGLEIRIERSDVAPIFGRLLVLIVKPITEDGRRLNERRNDVLPEIMLTVGSSGVLLERADENVTAEDVDPHRSESHILGSRKRGGSLWLLLKADDAIDFIDGDDAESRCLGE